MQRGRKRKEEGAKVRMDIQCEEKRFGEGEGRKISEREKNVCVGLSACNASLALFFLHQTKTKTKSEEGWILEEWI